MCRHNVRSLNLNMHVPEQIKQTTACKVAMADSICIINNSYHETFFMKFSAVLSAISAFNKGADIEKVRVCFACQCNTPTTTVIVKDCDSAVADKTQGVALLSTHKHVNCAGHHAKLCSKSILRETRFSESLLWRLREVTSLAYHAALTQGPSL